MSDLDAAATLDEFSSLPGDVGTYAKEQKTGNYVPRFSFPDGCADSLLPLFAHLWPGNLESQVAKVNAEFKKLRVPDTRPVTVSEFVRFMGVMLGAVQFNEKGKKLWQPDAYEGFRAPPNFKEYFPQNRFESIKKVAHYAFSDPSLKLEDPWWQIRQGIKDFNINRQQNIKRSTYYCVDETMSAYSPQTTKTGTLPHLSYIQRKPEPLGTELRSCCEGHSGIMVNVELQEGKDAMQKREFVKAYGANAASCLRITLDALHKP